MGQDQLGSLPAPPAGHARSSRHSSSRESARHVAFSENSGAPSTRHGEAFIPPPDLVGDHPKRFRPRLYACCAWGCILVFALALLALLLGFIFVAIFHSYLPVIRVRRFNATRITFNNQNHGKVHLKGEVDFLMEINNKNEKTELTYGTFKVSASAAQIDIGKTEFKAFHQAKKTSKALNGTVGINRSGVEKDDAQQLKQDIKNNEVDLKLFLSGTVTFPFAGMTMKEIPINAQCDCKQTEVDFGNNAKCDYRIFKA